MSEARRPLKRPSGEMLAWAARTTASCASANRMLCIASTRCERCHRSSFAKACGANQGVVLCRTFMRGRVSDRVPPSASVWSRRTMLASTDVAAVVAIIATVIVDEADWMIRL